MNEYATQNRPIPTRVGEFISPLWPKNKRLAEFRSPRPQFKKYNDKAAMTVLLGIICPNGIVMAADSQMTDESLGTIAYVDKISVIDFHVDEVLVAKSGLGSVTNRVVDIMREKARGVQIRNAMTVTKIVEDSIREAKCPLDQDQKDYVERHGAALLLAFYADGKPILCGVDIFGGGIVNPPSSHYEAAGIGKYVANYLMSEISEPNALDGIAMATAIYVIKKVKDHQKSYCGGDTVVKILGKFHRSDLEFQSLGKFMAISQDFVNIAEQKLVNLDAKAKIARNEQVLSTLRKIGVQVAQKRINRPESKS